MEEKKVPFYKQPLNSAQCFGAGAVLTLISGAVSGLFIILGIILLIVELFKKRFSWWSIAWLGIWFACAAIAQSIK